MTSKGSVPISYSGFELDESDVWSSVGGGVVSPDYRKPVVSSRKKPVNIPDWAKILKEDYKDNRRRDSDDDVDGEDLDVVLLEFWELVWSMIGPNECLWRGGGIVQ
ncbi:hypothetical protein RJ640_017727 [Escallonia rubra]|uniref:Uncharacterized protein n=1 Tax=Escallonia rubra TaxID=112253 RepID=A0AA88UP43_9ASTE|nr:hypothetical protein RJ640_017727 [Escallonia rubra]